MLNGEVVEAETWAYSAVNYPACVKKAEEYRNNGHPEAQCNVIVGDGE